MDGENSSISTELPVPLTKIKREILTPSPEMKTEVEDPLYDTMLPVIPKPLFGNFEMDEKKVIEPLKSSNEILAELFQVLNAAPPETLLSNVDYETKKQKKNKRKHKSKDKKHKKKSKKRKKEIEESSSDSDSDDSSHYRRPKKKIKRAPMETTDEIFDSDNKKHHSKSKRHKRKRSSLENSPKSTKIDNFDNKIKEELFSDLSEPPPVGNSPKLKEKIEAAESNTKTDGRSHKIVIKDLKNSAIFSENVLAYQKEKSKKKGHSHRSHKHDSKERDRFQEKYKGESSELSLSDEDSYLRDQSKDRYYEFGTEKYDDNYNDSNRGHSSRFKHDDFRSTYRGDKWRDRKRDFWCHERRQSRSRSNSRSRSRRRNSSTDDVRNIIDKKKLLEIARKNAITMLKSGSMPGTQNLAPAAKEKALARMRYGGKTIEELTDFCKKLSNGESMNDLSSVSSGNEDSDHDKEGNSKAFHHPFVLKDRGPIVMNIKNSVPIAPRSAEQTKAISLQFPVSSGQQHRINESEWVPVSPKKPESVPKEPKKLGPKLPGDKLTQAFTIIPTAELPPLIPTLTATPIPTSVPIPTPIPISIPIPTFQPTPIPAPESISIPAPAFTAHQPGKPATIFPDTSHAAKLDVSSIITKRLNAMRKLQENPKDKEAIELMQNAQKDMSVWATSKFTPGQFIGSTGANILSAKELQAGYQPWAKRDLFIKSAPVSGGMGMHLLQKMGWRPGEGLGKDKSGTLQPLLLEIKLDKKGLVANEENPNIIKKPKPTIAATQLNLDTKHPVSLLGELASKRKWGAPIYQVVLESGPGHNKAFLFKVSINGLQYTPNVTSASKKEAKAQAARLCLQKLGVFLK